LLVLILVASRASRNQVHSPEAGPLDPPVAWDRKAVQREAVPRLPVVPPKKERVPAAGPLTREELCGRWQDDFCNYEFHANGTFSALLKGCSPTTVFPVGYGDAITFDNRVWGTYTYHNQVLTMTFNGVPVPCTGRLTWQHRPDLLLFDQGLNGRCFFRRGN
jgi:hypothetical protein